jgi:hypothetical protein
MREPARALPTFRAYPTRLSDGVIVIKCVGQLRAEDTGYLPVLARMIEERPERSRIVFDSLDLEGYSAEFPLAHIPFFARHRARIGVAHTLRSIAFALATVALGSQTSIKGFGTLEETLSGVRGS